MTRACVVLGAGGHAKMVLDALLREGKHRPIGVTDPRPDAAPVLDLPLLGNDDVLPQLRKRGVRRFVVGMGGVPDNRPRARLYKKGCEAGLTPATAIHPSAVVARSARVGPGTVILPRAVVNPGCVVGSNVILNTGSVVEHDSHIADHVHVGPGAVICGEVQVGQGAFIGAGAIVIQGVSVGAWAVVGAGSVVLADVPDGERVAGVPARPLRKKRR